MSSAGMRKGRGRSGFPPPYCLSCKIATPGPCSDSGSQTIFPGSDAYYNYVLTLFGQGWDQHRFRFTVKGELLPDWGGECVSSR